MEKGRGIMYLAKVCFLYLVEGLMYRVQYQLFISFRLYRVNLSYYIKSVLTDIMQ